MVAIRNSRKSKVFRFNESDLLVTVLMENKTSRLISIYGNKSKFPRRRTRTGQKYSQEINWSISNPRTVLSWLIHSRAISLGEVIRFWSWKDGIEVKRGSITGDGILCTCCKNVFSISEFKSHASSELKFSCMNLVMGSGKPLILCQLEAWAAEYKDRKALHRSIDTDQSDDLCGSCGAVGELVCCDNCPATFHLACLLEKKIPEGRWYCVQCCCLTCGKVVKDRNATLSSGTLKCSLCKNKYHEKCMQGKEMIFGPASDTWFCQKSCYEVYTGLQSRIGSKNPVSDGISWTLLRCMDGDLKTHASLHFLAMKADCNAKLAVAITLMEQYFVEMLDVKTNISMIPQTIYNWGSQFGRLDFSGFYTVVLEENDVIVSAASIRIHGTQVAELPFIATCGKKRNKGLCRILLNSIEEMLKSLKVEKLLIPSHKELVGMWTNKFSFRLMDGNKKDKTRLMLLPGSIWLEKVL